ncbi:calmodulin-binding transcription activator 3 isoform X2 [Hevea brasiliensis]|nr:calmodulin-binding transcription activator 3 isoform X2 [Hevea brasiliensis]XP_058000824.1 calmodulin-binding transcription activator 3 isoform X2 [Hevea brasiliensis]XP_058000825.1 calmodulin-binding transcription activator 3 isoform X2 [Hevea brasiliensis]
MLDGKLEHIVLVHYREVKEGYRSGVSHLQADRSTQVDSPQPISAASIAQTASPAFTAQISYVSSPNRVDWNGQTLSSEVEDVDSRDDVGASLTEPMIGSLSRNASLLANEVEGLPPGSWFNGVKFDHSTGSSLWTEIPGSSKYAYHVPDQKFYVGQPRGADVITRKLTDSRLDGDIPDSVATGDRLINNVDDQALAAIPQRLILEHVFNLIPSHFVNHSGSRTTASTAQVDNKPKDGGASTNELGELKKLDSFGRWMDKEIGGDCDDSLMASDSGNYWNTLDTENDDKEVSSLSHHMQLDIESLGPSLSQEQLFSIRDFSPDWAYSGVETKVLIIGTFLGSKKFSSETKWGCMFGEIEVSAEVLTDNVIRCQAPLHATGRVPFYVTCCNRLACSEVREFEYRENPSRVASMSTSSVQEEELRFQVRLAKLLHLGQERKWLNCSIDRCDKCKLRSTLYSMRNKISNELARARESCMVSEVNCTDARDKFIQSLLSDRLCEWLVCKVHGGGKGPDVLDGEGQGVIHLTAGLGYEWAMGLIVAASNNPNFRDAQGRTALHWASYFGREETVIALVRLGVDPTAVDDPTPTFPGGKIAADLASSQGHKGIAGFLAEAFLTGHLSSLNIKENVTDTVDATIAAEKATETAAQVAFPLSGGADDQFSLKESLAAVRKSTIAAALIQAAYRSYSFRYRQFPKSSDDSEVSLDLAALGPLKKDQSRSHFEDYLHSAAVRIQQKYRGWKRRKEFLKIRNRIVKIQAHVRGHRVRRQYKKVIWSVSIVEKAILRWRRKRPGLRGFRVEKLSGDVIQETEKTNEYEFLRIGRKQKFAGVEKALARVKSMVRDPVARDQYMRLITKSEHLKMSDEGISVSRQDES